MLLPIEKNNYWIKIIMIELNKNMKYYLEIIS